MNAIALRPRTSTELIDASFQLLRQYYFHFVALTIVALLPYIVVRAVVTTNVMDLSNILLLFVVQMICTAVAEGAIITAVSDSYLEGRAEIDVVLGRTMSRVLSIIAAGLLRGVLVMVAAIALIFPGIYVGLRTFSVTAVLLLERESVTGSISRSWALGKGEVGKIFVTLLLAWLLYLVLFLVLGAIVGIFLSGRPNLAGVLTAAMMAFAYPFVGVVTTLLYYDIRVRREGLDLELMARGI